MSPGLDSVLAGSPCNERAKKGRVGIKTDEIIIRCDCARDSAVARDTPENVEGDELIWWSWDGKIVGFSDL